VVVAVELDLVVLVEVVQEVIEQLHVFHYQIHL
jgi:hypothetical protein